IGLFAEEETVIEEAKIEEPFVLISESNKAGRDFVGAVEAKKSVTLSSEVSGHITYLPFDVGNEVKKGQMVAKVKSDALESNAATMNEYVTNLEDSKDDNHDLYDAHVDTTKRRKEVAKENYENAKDSGNEAEKRLAKKLYDEAKDAHDAAKDREDVSKKGFDTQLDLARGQRDTAYATLANNSLYAPFNGTVVTRDAEVGKVVGFGVPFITLADLSGYKVSIFLPDVSINSISEGQTASVKIDGMDEEFSGKVTRIEPITSFGGKIKAEITLDQTDINIPLGATSRVSLDTPVEDVYFVPKHYVVADFDGLYVIFEDGTRQKVDMKDVKEGMVRIDFDGIEDGLQLVKPWL
ncbi:MAG: HlyD family efflux transporter periplasmic adaptor subunit, partial [Patescibacteria group bacterium]